MHPPVFQRQLSEPLSSTDFLLDTIKGKADKIVQRHFSFLKRYVVSANDMNDGLLAANAFELSEFIYIKNLPNNIYKMERILKQVIRKGRESCFLLVKVLCKLGHANVLRVITLPEVDQAPSRNYESITKDFLQLQTKYICSRLEIHEVLDILYEKDVLTIDDHDKVQKQKHRGDKRKMLLLILYDKSTIEWVPVFLTALWMSGHERLLDELQRRRIEINDAMQGQEIRLGNTVPIAQYVAHIANAEGEHQAGNVDSLGFDVENLIEEWFDAGIVEYWEGSIYFLLSTASPGCIEGIMHRKDDQRLKMFLRHFFQNNRKLMEQFGTDKVLKFEIKQKPNHTFLDEKYGKVSSIQDRKHHTEDCIDCFQATVRGNYAGILDEIESDMIRETLAKMQNPSRFIKERCLKYSKTREEAATTFLQYVLANAIPLQVFRDVLSFRSDVSWTSYKCNVCQGLSDDKKPVEVQKMTLHFRIISDNNGGIEISELPEQKQVPMSRRKLIRSKSAKMIELKENKEMMRLICIENSGYPVICETYLKNNFKLCVVPALNGDRHCEQNRQNCVAECFGRTSPGPHAFITISDIDNLRNVEQSVQPYEQHFGSKMWNYLILILVIDPQLTNYSNTEDMMKKVKLISRLGEQHVMTVTKDFGKTNEFVETLTGIISLMQSKNVADHFSNEIFEATEKRIQRETKMIEDINQLKIEQLEERIADLKNVNPRKEATSQLTEVFLKTVNEYASYNCN